MHTVEETFVGPAVATEIVKDTGLSCVTTTLYDLMSAMHNIVGPEDDKVVVATIDRMLRTGRIAFLESVIAPDRKQ